MAMSLFPSRMEAQTFIIKKTNRMRWRKRTLRQKLKKTSNTD
jgi:hypothetical protein